ncbi:hypothetical protein [Pedobacter faecalis]|uniref:hypothetical protein n=1 Tax=Pedobacter faecalis TaxID=3041495 RepID=UPI00254F7B29|nr:hypothetical protein [Pedobacter sp. ELA7]
MITSIKKGDQFVCVDTTGFGKDVFAIGQVYHAISDTAITCENGSCGGWDLNNINQHFIPYTYGAVWEQYKAAKTMEDAEPYANLLREFEKSMPRSTSGGGNYKAPLLERAVDRTENEVIRGVKLPEYYDNSKGSLYKVAQDRGWNSYQFDAVKRIDRALKKGQFKQDIEKTIALLKLWLEEAGFDADAERRQDV